jgi:hypothetical protein
MLRLAHSLGFVGGKNPYEFILELDEGSSASGSGALAA